MLTDATRTQGSVSEPHASRRMSRTMRLGSSKHFSLYDREHARDGLVRLVLANVAVMVGRRSGAR